MSGLKWAVIAVAVPALLLVLALAVAAYGSRRWELRTQLIHAQLEGARKPPLPARYDARELAGLPPRCSVTFARH